MSDDKAIGPPGYYRDGVFLRDLTDAEMEPNDDGHTLFRVDVHSKRGWTNWFKWTPTRPCAPMDSCVLILDQDGRTKALRAGEAVTIRYGDAP